MADTEWRLGHRPGLDQLRGVAVLGVVWAHSSSLAPRSAGSVGVGAFLTLSGFLITRLLIEEQDRAGRVDLRQFYARRGRRLLPALPVFVCFAATVSAIAGVDWVRGAVGVLTYTANYSGQVGFFQHAWSLAVEEHFYLVWPVLVMAVPRRWLVPLAVSVSAVSIALRLVEQDQTMAYQATHLRLDALLIGAVGAVVVDRWRGGHWTFLAGVMMLAACVPLQTSDFVGLPATVVSIAALLVVLALTDWPWRCRPLEYLGRISYGVYLFHYPVAGIMRRAAGSLSLSQAAIMLAISVGLAALSYRFVEAPLRASKSAVSGGSGQRPVADVAEVGRLAIVHQP